MENARGGRIVIMDTRRLNSARLDVSLAKKHFYLVHYFLCYTLINSLYTWLAEVGVRMLIKERGIYVTNEPQAR